jgi:hypothetical protein
MALVNDDQVEEVGRRLLEGAQAVGPGRVKALVDGEVDLPARPDRPALELLARIARTFAARSGPR